MPNFNDQNLTPMLKQYLEFKKLHPDKLILFRMGDFYETFFEDAEIASKVLGITLTSRNKKNDNSAPLAGFPYHSLKTYLEKLVRNGLKVVICEQVEDPKQAKGLVKRDIVEIITPGAIIDDNLINSNENNFLSVVYIAEKAKIAGISFLDISTGDFLFTELSCEDLFHELVKMSPQEIIVTTEKSKLHIQSLKLDHNPAITIFEEGFNDFRELKKILKEHFKTITLEGFGIGNKPFGAAAAALALSYVKSLYKNELTHVNSLRYYTLQNYLQLDEISLRNLEILKTIRFNSRPGSLISVLDNTQTPMGARLLNDWLIRPLLDEEKINQRLDCIEVLFKHINYTEDLRHILQRIGDLSRIISKISTFRVNPRDLIALKNYLSTAPKLIAILNTLVEIERQETPDFFNDYPGKQEKSILANLKDKILDYTEIIKLIQDTLTEEPPIQITQGNIIASGHSEELDELRSISKDGKSWIARLEDSEKQKTGINSLKIGYNKVFGYYIEVTNLNLDKVPDYYICKQTLSGSQRYFSPQLKEYESKVLSAEERIKSLEYELFDALRDKLHNSLSHIMKFVDIISEIDVYTNFAFISYKNSYTRPVFNQEGKFYLINSRHPVIEKLINEEDFIPNDVELNNDEEKVIIITGPNMAGKSTYLRQIGLIAVMAQIGCFVPAEKADICIFDRIFTRVGASDNLAMGQSTFLVEMIETANILNSATPSSLILLDEIGRGTSTFDGLSLAWSIIEYIVKNPKINAKTLFATHYHEITELEYIYSNIKNYNIAIKEINEELIFLRKIQKGPADKSYGIQVARLAGLPKKVISRAQKILKNLEQQELSPNGLLAKARKEQNKETEQLDFFDEVFEKANLSDDLIEEINNIDVKNTTPMEAIQLIVDLQDRIKKGK